MLIRENISLRPYNTFRINVVARYLATFNNQDELEELLENLEPQRKSSNKKSSVIPNDKSSDSAAGLKNSPQTADDIAEFQNLKTNPESTNSERNSKNQQPQTRNPKPETGNKNPETGNKKPETRNTKPETRNPLILGGGSNILLTSNLDGWVLKNDIMGIETVKEDEEHVYLKVGAGENWHQFVMFCVENGFAGVENLSLIPGNVGASPMQNIGAYGVELKEVFHDLEAMDLHDRKVHTFSLHDCEFGYRDSIFKRRYKDQFAILTVTFRLNKHPRFNTSYGALEQELERMGVKQLSIRAISQAVINIRSSKLPDPAEIGNAGSFFKNPTVNLSFFEKLKKEFPSIIGYKVGEDEVKLAAGWLIEQCGWKGLRKGDAGCHSKQALVLVNYGDASGNEIYDLSEEILRSVEKKFNVLLEREVNIIS